jgi:hypothetical protein
VVKSQIYINNTLIDLKDDLPIDLNYEIAEISQPESRQANYSKTITIPSTKSNDVLFTHIFEINRVTLNTSTTNFNPDFNPNLKAEAVIYSEGVKQFDGVAQLLNINRLDDNDITYEIVILGNIITPFVAIGEKYLSEIDLSEYDHDYTRSNIDDSWATQIKQGGVNVPFAIGNGYVYPLIDYGITTDEIEYPVSAWRPAVYLKTIVDKIFEDIGFTYTSSFFTSTLFKRLIIPFSGTSLRLTSTQINDRKFRAELSSTQTINVTALGIGTASATTVVFNNDSTGGNFDNSGQYNNATGVFTVGAALAGTFSFNSILRLGFTLTPATAGVNRKQAVELRCWIKIVKNGTTTIASWTEIMKHDSFFTTTYSSANPTTTLPDPDFSNAVFNPTSYININTSGLGLVATDTIRIDVVPYLYNDGTFYSGGAVSSKLFTDGAGTFETGTIDLKIYSGSTFYNNISNAEIVEGQTVLMNNVLPEKVKQKDLLTSLIKAFNLYWDIDPSNSKNVIIEPRNDYYTTDILDWSAKLDKINGLVIRPMGALEARVYNFMYKSDKDYWNERYQNKNGEPYGSRIINVNNDFNKSTKNIELIFSPTPLVGNDAFDRIISQIIKIDDNGVVSPSEGNIRLLYYSGLKTTNALFTITEAGGTINYYDEYPYAGHVDNPYNVTVDLSFGVPIELFYDNRWSSITYSNANLYNTYWKNHIDEITDKDSKIVTGYFNLKPYDMGLVSFRKLYFFEGAYYRLNKIIGYNPNGNDLTKCEFLKLVTTPDFAPITYDTVGDIQDAFSGENSPGFGDTIYGGNTSRSRGGSLGDVVTQGTNIRIGANVRFTTVIGNNVTVGGNCRNCYVNSNNVVLTGGVSNATVINSPNLTISDSNVTVINGQYQNGENSTILFSGASPQASFTATARTFLFDCTSTNKNMNLPDAYLYDGMEYDCKKMDSGTNKFRLTAYSGQTIDGASFLDVYTQYDSFRIKSYNGNWIIK